MFNGFSCGFVTIITDILAWKQFIIIIITKKVNIIISSRYTVECLNDSKCS